MSKIEMGAMLGAMLSNNDAALRLLSEGPLSANHDLWRALRWHASNGDAEWLEESDEYRITEHGRRTLERLEWRLANPKEADRQDRETMNALLQKWAPK